MALAGGCEWVHSTRAHLARAALEAIADQIRDVLNAMAVESGSPLVYAGWKRAVARTF